MTRLERKLDLAPRNSLGVTIDERKIGKTGHQFVGELRAMSWWIDALKECVVGTVDKAEKAVAETMLELAHEYKWQVEADFVKLARARGALEVIEGMNSEELPQ